MSTQANIDKRIAALPTQKAELLLLLLDERNRKNNCVTRIATLNGVSNRLTGGLSLAQQRIWFDSQAENNASPHQLSALIRLRGPLNTGALRASLNALLARHEVLRTHFSHLDGGDLRVITAQAAFELEEIEVSGSTEGEKELQIRQHIVREMRSHFDLMAGPLIRGQLIRLNSNEHCFTITTHQIVSDEWSMEIFLRELANVYSAFVTGQPKPLQPLPISYLDYAEWQKQWLQGRVLDDQLEYWSQQLKGAPPLELPKDRARPATLNYQTHTAQLLIGANLSNEIKTFARKHNATLFMVLCTGLAILLSRLSGQDDIVIGTIAANRRRTELEGIVGAFENTLMLRVRLSDRPCVKTLLTRVKDTIVSALSNQDALLDCVVDVIKPPRELGFGPIFQVMLVLQSVPEKEIQLPGMLVETRRVVRNRTDLDLTISLSEAGQTIVGQFEYASELFNESTVVRWGGYFKTVLAEMIRDPEQSVSGLALLSHDEMRELLVEWNDTRRPFPSGSLIHELFEQKVAMNSGAVALIDDEEQVPYGELNARANQLAHYLRNIGVTPDARVAICVERSIAMVVSLLGILKAGGAYIPLDPSYPPQRLAFMLSDSCPRIVLTEQALVSLLPKLEVPIVILDSEEAQLLVARQCRDNPDPRTFGLTSRHLAYIIYTSGSTGVPKGVMVEHRGVVNCLVSMQAQLDIAASDCMLALTTLSFDIAALEVFLPLISGARVVLASRERAADALLLIETICKFSVNILQATPAAWRLLMSEVSWIRPQLKALCGGEALTRELAAQIQSRVGALWNLYGPTETTIWCCSERIAISSTVASLIESIGRPIANTEIYLLDNNLEPVPIGVVGEVFIGGAGIARGYLNQPALTAERFIVEPFRRDIHTPIYRTGDLARWRADGKIDFLGRNDQQVKIRGFRIELGEIEEQLLLYPGVREAVVVAREDDPEDKRLVAYLSTTRGTRQPQGLSTEALRARLSQTLPHYMLPAAFVELEALPLTPNGKIDRNALPAPDISRGDLKMSYVAPRTSTEEMLARIWAEVLKLDRVGVHDNFFDLGGHSLTIVRVLARIKKSVRSHLSIRDFFDYSTIAQISLAVESRSNQDGV